MVLSKTLIWTSAYTRHRQCPKYNICIKTSQFLSQQRILYTNTPQSTTAINRWAKSTGCKRGGERQSLEMYPALWNKRSNKGIRKQSSCFVFQSAEISGFLLHKQLVGGFIFYFTTDFDSNGRDRGRNILSVTILQAGILLKKKHENHFIHSSERKGVDNFFRVSNTAFLRNKATPSFTVFSRNSASLCSITLHTYAIQLFSVAYYIKYL